MRYVFLGLMGVFAGLYAAIKHRGSFGARLTVKTIASAMFVLAAFAGRVDADEPYFALILIGLCLSLAGDVLLVFPGQEMFVAGGIAFLLAHIGYIAAFFVYAPLAWYDAVLFAAFVAISAAAFAGKKLNLGRNKPLTYIYALVLCATTAKAFSMLFARGVSPLYAAFAALGGALFALSDLALAHEHFYPYERKLVSVLSTLAYYVAQALIALSIAL